MAWEISHHEIVWTIAEVNLRSWSIEELANALSDDFFEMLEEDDTVDDDTIEKRYERRKRTLLETGYIAKDTLVRCCLDTIRENNTCDNGGFNLYIDRQGYHTVPTDLQECAKEFATGEELDAIEYWTT